MKDAVVIIIFAATVSIAAVFVEGADFNAVLLLFVVFEILLDIGLGLLVGVVLRLTMNLPYNWLKSGWEVEVGK